PSQLLPGAVDAAPGLTPPAAGCEPRESMERDSDVVIVGAALAGLVAGAILTRRGKRVVILDHADTVGGRGGAVERPGGWWIDFGHRDGHDVGDCQVVWHHGAEAAHEAGVEIALHPVEAPLRLHRFPEGTVLEGGAWPSCPTTPRREVCRGSWSRGRGRSARAAARSRSAGSRSRSWSRAAPCAARSPSTGRTWCARWARRP